MSFAQNPTANTIAGVVVLLMVGFKVGSCRDGDKKGNSEEPGTSSLVGVPKVDRVQNVAETLVEQKLKAPATARFEPAEILKKEHPWYQVLIVVHAQNSFGALIKERFVCTFRLEPDSKFTSHRTWGVQKYVEIPGSKEALDTALEVFREDSGWGKSQ